MGWTYDPTNIFARILRGEIPNRTVMETPHTLVFHDIRPLAPVHVLVIPKGAYVSFDDFAANASNAEILGFTRLCAQVCMSEGVDLAGGNQGFRAVANTGHHGVQEVPHYLLHIMGGRVMGPMLSRQG